MLEQLELNGFHMPFRAVFEFEFDLSKRRLVRNKAKMWTKGFCRFMSITKYKDFDL